MNLDYKILVGAQLIQVAVLVAVAVQNYFIGKMNSKIHLATNSMKDALVKSTGEAAFSKGEAAGEQKEISRQKSETKTKQ